MADNVIKIKSFDFALKIINLSRFLIEEIREYIMSKQLARSGTAIGEAEQAESKKDFIHKMSIALKEANETEYWMELLYQSRYIDKDSYVSITTDLKEILKLLTSIIKTAKHNL